jgi:hypothetical protein
VTTYKIRIQPTNKSICVGVFPPTNERLNADEIVLRPNVPITASAPNRIVSIVMSACFPCRGFFRAEPTNAVVLSLHRACSRHRPHRSR